MTDRDKRQGDRPFKSGAKKDFDKKPFGKKPFGKKPGGPAKGRKPAAAPAAAPKAFQGERIAKAMARAGACSRRDAEEWIAAGRVAVNGRTLESPAFNVTSTDKITIDGRPMAARDRTRLYLFHKPRGLVTTDHDPEGRQTIFDYLSQRHPELPRLMTVGRLDINTEGLLLMTNDGGLARTLELPQTGWLRRYRVRAHGETDQAALDTLARGVTIDDVQYAPVEAKLDRAQGANTWITMGLREGKNREVRRVLGSLGLEVNRLIRVSYGPFQLGELAEGTVEEVKTRVLRDQLGPSLIAQSQADFDTPERDERDEGDRAPRRGEREGSERAPRGREERPRPDRDRTERPRFDRERPGRDRPDRDRPARGAAGQRRDEEPEVKRERPKAGPRKHVSTLRLQRDKRVNLEGRVKIERGETADRKGRAIKVERVVSTVPKAEADTRNGRRFKAERDGDRPMRRSTRDERGGDRAQRGERPARSERPQRSDDRGGSRGERPFSAPRPPREGGERNPRFERAPRSEGARAPRADGDKRFSRDERGGDRPFKRPERAGGERSGPRPGGDFKGPRSGGERSGGDRKGPRPGGGDFKGPRSGSDRPGGDRKGGRPAGPRPNKDRPGGDRKGPRPGGDRPRTGGPRKPPRGGK